MEARLHHVADAAYDAPGRTYNSTICADFSPNNWFNPAYPLASEEVLQANRTLVHCFLATLTMQPDDGHPERTAIQRHRIAQGVSLEVALRDLLVPLKVPASTDAQHFTGLMLQLRRALERDPHETCTVYLMSPSEVRNRSVGEEGRIPNLFQGEYPVERSKRGSIYPGDRAIRAPNQVTIQIHMLTLTDRAERPLVARVPVVAVWVPSRLAESWIVQDDPV